MSTEEKGQRLSRFLRRVLILKVRLIEKFSIRRASRRRCRRLMPGFLLQYSKGISGHRTSEPCFQRNRDLTIISNICWYIHENFRRTGPMELIECLSLLFGNPNINQVQFLGFNLHAVEINSVGDRRDYEKQDDNELFIGPIEQSNVYVCSGPLPVPWSCPSSKPFRQGSTK